MLRLIHLQALVLVATAQAGLESSDPFAEQVRPLLERRCTPCHETEDPAGDLDLERFRTLADAVAEPLLWRAVSARMAAGEMPPALVRERPTAQELATVTAWVEVAFGPPAAGTSPPSSGRTTLRRLNRLELRHALQDLFGVDTPTAELLPADGVSHGFDVIGDALSLSPILLEKCFDLAEAVAAEAVPREANVGENARRVVALDLTLGENNDYAEWSESVNLYSNGQVTATFDVARGGEYLVRVAAAAQQAGPDPARLQLSMDGDRLDRHDVLAPVRSPEVYESRVRLRPGERVIAAAFVNDYYDEDSPDRERRDRNLFVSWLELVGPIGVDARTPFEARWLEGEGEWSAHGVLTSVAPLVWRGPVAAELVDELEKLAPEGSSERDKLRAALIGLMASPRFLFRVEPEPASGPRPLEPHELATRLAAFLWASVPDETGLQRAVRGDLVTNAGLDSEVARMLDDPRASRLARGFARSWLQLGRLEASQPDPRRFPDFDDELREAMFAETELFFEAVLREERPISTLIVADFTFANGRLAEHYGIIGVEGTTLRRVPVPAHLRARRGGLLGQASVLTASSFPARSSPVLRGKWVLEALLATPPPPPPPGVGTLAEAGEAITAATVRERLEQHRRDPACAACHAPMDGLGFALENFDATGGWRDRDGDTPIDTRAELPGTAPFEGLEGLRHELLSRTEFRDGLARHLLVYALGRGLAPADEADLRATLAGLPRDPTLRELIQSITSMESFLTRFPEPLAPRPSESATAPPASTEPTEAARPPSSVEAPGTPSERHDALPQENPHR